MAALEVWLQSKFIQSALIVAISLAAAFLVYILIKLYLKKIAKKTKTDLDDILLEKSALPLFLLIFMTGLYYALKHAAIVTDYSAWVHSGTFVLIVFFIAWLLSGIMSVLTSRWFKKHRRNQKAPKLLNKIVVVVIFLIAIIFILGYYDVEITPLIATLGIGGLAVGLALQNTLSNFFAGLHILSDQPVTVGDFVELPGSAVSGHIEDIGWRSTRIRTLSNTFVIVPNSKLAESIIVNDSLPEKEMSLVIPCGVAYESDLAKVEKVTVDVAKKIQKNTEGAIPDFEPFIRYNEFGDSNINFSVILRMETYVNKYLIKHEFIKALKKRYDKEKIDISWPVQKNYFADSKGKLKNKL